PVSIQMPSGQLTAPTSASIAAAVATMKTTADGLLVPDVTALTPQTTSSTKTAATVIPYPLTYVVYAFVPAEPLTDPGTCAPRTQSQTLLTDWLTYLTGAGQQALPAGLEPLPAALSTQAKDAIAKVGAQSSTCVPAPGTGGTTAGGLQVAGAS